MGASGDGLRADDLAASRIAASNHKGQGLGVGDSQDGALEQVTMEADAARLLRNERPGLN